MIMSKDNNSKIIHLKQSDALIQSELVKESIYYIDKKDVKISLNSGDNIIFTIDRKKWQNNLYSIEQQAIELGIHEKEKQKLLKRHLSDNYDLTLNSDNEDNENTKGKELEDSKKKLLAYKYSKMGKNLLHEAVIVNGLPFFLKYDNISNTFELLENIIENSRILRPPQIEEYPYIPYEFESYEELQFYITKAKNTTLDELFITRKSIFEKYVDQDKHVISLLTADSIWSYFQDLFPVTHYLEGVGDNDVGKSTIGYTFEYTGYRVIKGTAISGANYYRSLGTDEPGQCTIIEDEGDSISEDPDKIKILKAGYEYNGKVPKINMNYKNQEQKWYKPYGFKMILAEKSLSQLKAKGLLDRTFSFHCRPGKVKYSIKEVVSGNNKNPLFQILYNELLNNRKLMLCYRMVHFKDLLPQIKTGLKNRDNELCKPLLQLFYGTKAIKEIIDTLKIFVKQRRERRSSSIEGAIYPIIKELLLNQESQIVNKLDQVQNKEVKYSKIWDKIKNGAIEGTYNDKKPTQYETVSYGILFNNKLSTFIANKFGAKLDPKRDGSVLTFDIDKLKLFENIYGETAEIEVIINVEIETIESVENYNDYN